MLLSILTIKLEGIKDTIWMPSQPLMNDNNDFFPGRARKLREAREKREEKERKKNKPPKPCHSCFANTHRTGRKPLA
jgi:hypothetical protein